MVKKTPRLNLDTFEEGEKNWDHTDAVEALDESAIQRGNISNRPKSGEYDDELYYATDQNVLWGWDESEGDWTIRGGLGSEDQRLPSLYTDSLDSRCIKAGSAKNTLSSITPSFYVNASDNGLGIALQQTDDEEGVDSAVPHVRWFSSTGERVAQLKAHAPHNHFSLYTRDRPLDGSVGGWHKRLDVESAGDTEDGQVNWRRTRRLEVENKFGPAFLRLSSNGGQPTGIHWGQELKSETQEFTLLHKPDREGKFILRDKYNNLDAFCYSPHADSPIWDFIGDGCTVKSVRSQSGGVAKDEVPEGALVWDSDHSRMLFKDEENDVHYFESDGKL